ncbi:TolB family protein [Luteibaculum oceani]|uniref:Dipeptidylpeptidase IV N-terminal domain-containing protein n=1 Tax=Luteibaculum oceani TaxID=1294296 RepID=A0A5C6V8F6_9FLAO|nr:PD40 domain-containing protein [Luteibaculum oceani]TXC81643.1 hypothetical protein FRX97_03765 [Luteibaculum oceani]
MKKLIGWGIIITLIFVLGCKSEPEQAKTYVVAYNVWAPDSIYEDNYEIFSIDLNGNQKKNLTNHGDVAWTYMAVGDEIYFISDRDTCYRCFYLYRMKWDGSNLEQVSNIRLRDSWMGSRKNGEEIIVNPHPTVDSCFYILNKAGFLISKVCHGLAYANDPCFSPDGDKIVFRGSKIPFKKNSDYKDELFIMDANGQNVKQLTSYPTSDTTAKWHNYHAGPPRWHPTENFISYQSKQNGKYSLFAIKPKGGKSWKLTEQSFQEGWHDWSSDGKWLAVESFDLAGEDFNIHLINWKTKEIKILTDSSYRYEQAPVFVEIPKAQSDL